MRVQQTARGSGSNNGLANIMKLIIALVFTATLALLNITARPQPKPVVVHLEEKVSAQASSSQDEKADHDTKRNEDLDKPVFNAKDASTWPKCEAGQIVRADNGKCAKAATPPATASVAPSGAVSGSGVGDCAAEIAKYNWTHSTAIAVARAESGLNPGSLNDNPATGDYSVGCFQVNIYGANAASRPSEAALKNAAVNVAFAHKIYVGNGNSFIGQWGVCRAKVACY